MIAVCYAKSPKKSVIRQARTSTIEVEGSEKPIVQLRPAIEIEFERLGTANEGDLFDASMSPGNKRAPVWGMLSLDEAARNTGLSVEELVYWLLTDPAYNTDRGYLVIRSNGDRVQSMEDWIIHRDLESDDKNAWRCIACDQALDVRGTGAHAAADRHKDAVVTYRAKLKAKILGLQRDYQEVSSVARL